MPDIDVVMQGRLAVMLVSIVVLVCLACYLAWVQCGLVKPVIGRVLALFVAIVVATMPLAQIGLYQEIVAGGQVIKNVDNFLYLVVTAQSMTVIGIYVYFLDLQEKRAGSGRKP